MIEYHVEHVTTRDLKKSYIVKVDGGLRGMYRDVHKLKSFFRGNLNDVKEAAAVARNGGVGKVYREDML